MSIYFGIVLSLVTYLIGVYLKKKTNSQLCNPLLISIVLCILVLQGFHIPNAEFQKGGAYISFLIAPSTVALIVPLYKQRQILKENLVAILSGIIAGVFTSLLSTIFMVKLLHLDNALAISVLPKSITTAIGMDLSSELGGIASVTAAIIIFTGILGAILAPGFLKLIGVHDEIATGIALGTSAHAVGTSRAMELGELQGAMSGLCIGIAGIITALVLPLLLPLL